MENINKKIIDIKYKMIRKEQLNRHQKDLEERIEAEAETLNRFKRELEKEEMDVSRLEGISIGTLLQKINGGKGLRLEKEKAEVARAALDFKQKQSDVEYMKYELNLLATQLKDYESLDTDLEEYIELKKKMISPEIRSQIKTMESESLSLQITNKEIKEAKDAGEKVSSSLNAIIEHMDTYLEDSTDPMFSYPDHEELTDMAKEASIYKELWSTFKKEVKDTGLDINFKNDDSMIDSFSDYVYVQEDDRKVMVENVHRSYEELTELYGNIKEILQLLTNEYDKNAYHIDDLTIEINKIIEEN